ncbi:MAG TPA: retropepsin-like aspartic protease [Niastella sp.]
MKILSMAVMAIGLCIACSAARAQTKLPLIKSTKKVVVIQDGKHLTLNWHLDPKLKPDIYYVNTPRRKRKVTFQSDQGKLSFKTRYGKSYDFVVLLNEKDSCFTRIVAREAPTGVSLQLQQPLPDTIPFTLMGSRICLQGLLNGKKQANMQFDTGAGTSCVSKTSSEKLNLSFTEKTMLSNSQGINEVRRSMNNQLAFGHLDFSGISLVETGNMQPGEDLIIGNYLFRDKIIEIDYDKKLFIVHGKLPVCAKTFTKQPMIYGLNIKSTIVQNGKKYSFWFGFDTGRDGTMLLREDFTGQADNWKNLKELTMVNGRKIVRLDATIAGVVFKDIVTNAADPSKPAARRAGSLFGNEILNHFNVILDNLNGYIYLKANSRSNEPYCNYQNYKTRD